MKKYLILVSCSLTAGCLADSRDCRFLDPGFQAHAMDRPAQARTLTQTVREEPPRAPNPIQLAEARSEETEPALELAYARTKGGPAYPHYPVSFQELEKRDDNGKKNGNGKKEDEPPKHIRDNAFLVEEAFNQEPGDVQHVLNWLHFWDRGGGQRTRDLAFSYTMELPICTQKHQFSFTTQMFDFYERPDGGAAAHQGGAGDTFLNYRYQLFGAEDDLWWCAPGATLILPTGDERFGLGTGQLGYQFKLPVSRYGEIFDFHFNAGVTYIPNVSIILATGGKSLPQDLQTYNLGGSVFWKPRVDLHWFVEVLGLWAQEMEDVDGTRDSLNLCFVNPGVRYAVYQGDGIEWVLGVSVPVGLTRDTPDIGVFAYMSIEHSFRKKPEENGQEKDD